MDTSMLGGKLATTPMDHNIPIDDLSTPKLESVV